MKTHELAGFLDSLRIGLDAGLTQPTKSAFHEAAEAFRAIPNQTLKAFVAQIQDKPSTVGNRTGNGRSTGLDVGQLIERIRRVQAGSESAESVLAAVRTLKVAGIDEVLAAFALKKSGNKSDKIDRICSIVGPKPASLNGHHASESTATDAALVEEGVQIFRRLRDATDVSIEEVRDQFRPVLQYPKSVLSEITRDLGFTPVGTADEMAKRLLSNLEGIKLSQLKGEWILSGT